MDSKEFSRKMHQLFGEKADFIDEKPFRFVKKTRYKK